MGAGLTVSQIKAQKAAKKKVSDISNKVTIKKDPFGDDSDDGDDILIVPKKTKESKPSILDDPLLSVPSLNESDNTKKETVKKEEVQKKKVSSFFDDDDFFSKPKKKKKSKKKKSLF